MSSLDINPDVPVLAGSAVLEDGSKRLVRPCRVSCAKSLSLGMSVLSSCLTLVLFVSRLFWSH